MAADRDRAARRLIAGLSAAAVLIAAGWVFPPFHVVRLAPAVHATALFDATAAATKVWHDDIPAAAATAPEAAMVVAALRRNVDAAAREYGHTAGLGTVYFIVRGHGRVIARERNQLAVSLDGAPGEVVTLRIGPVFGNTVRDGCGRLNVNAYPGLAEFNALSGALNALVEQRVLPALRERAKVGATITFAGCAAGPDTIADPGEPVLTIVPVEARVP